MEQKEVTYYEGSSVRVTNARAILGAKTYAMANITSVAIGKQSANRTPGVIIALIGLIITGIIAASDGGGGGIAIGVIVLIVGIVVAVLAKNTYIVRIGSASGEADALVSTNKEYINKIVSAMNEAIVQRG